MIDEAKERGGITGCGVVVEAVESGPPCGNLLALITAAVPPLLVDDFHHEHDDDDHRPPYKPVAVDDDVR
jgi:hypothetical protein